jgi:hypothetical protein
VNALFRLRPAALNLDRAFWNTSLLFLFENDALGTDRRALGIERRDVGFDGLDR